MIRYCMEVVIREHQTNQVKQIMNIDVYDNDDLHAMNEAKATALHIYGKRHPEANHYYKPRILHREI